MSYYYNYTNELLIHSENPFINLTQTLSKNNIKLDLNIVNLFKSLLNSDLIDTYNINEFYFIKETEEKISYQNILSSLCLLNTNISQEEYENFFNLLFSKGLKIEENTLFQFNKNINNLEKFSSNLNLLNYLKENENLYRKGNTHSIYGRMDLNDDKLFYLLSQGYTSLESEEHLRLITKYETYHNSVKHNKIKLIKLLDSQGISVNIKNKNLTTPLMCAKHKETILLLDSLNADWLAVNVFNDDAFSSFTKISDKSLREEMLDYAKKKLEQNTNKKNEEHDNDYIQERLKINLLKLVSSDKTKAELHKYIKLNKLENIQDITDNEGNNLFMICLLNNNWARANLFIDNVDLNHKNNKGHDALFIMLSKTKRNITRVKDATIILEALLKNYQINIQKKEVEKSLFISLLNERVNSTNYLSTLLEVPTILFQKNSRLFPYLGFNQEQSNNLDAEIKNMTSYYNYNNLLENENKEKIINFYLDGYEIERDNLNIKCDLNLNNILNKIFRKDEQYNNKSLISYSVEKKLWQDFVLIVENMNTRELINSSLYYNTITERVISFINEGFEKHHSYSNKNSTKEEKEKSQQDFINNTVELVQFLVDNKRIEDINKLNKKILFHDYEDENLKIGLKHAILTKTLEDLSSSSKENDSLTKKRKLKI